MLHMTDTAFAARLSAARTAMNQCKAAIRPLDPETVARMKRFVGEAEYAKLEALVALEAAKLPALVAAFNELDHQACSRCAGTGDYSAPTSRYKGGRPVCFSCKGSGKRTR